MEKHKAITIKTFCLEAKFCRKYFIIFRNEKYPKPENSLIHKRRKIFEYEFFFKASIQDLLMQTFFSPP